MTLEAAHNPCLSNLGEAQDITPEEQAHPAPAQNPQSQGGNPLLSNKAKGRGINPQEPREPGDLHFPS